jgi:archaeosine-15-forming tRNA-guanine transglycosylase
MKPKFRVILEQALEEGVKRGYRRAFKHIEDPTEESICQHIEEQVMSSLYEYFDFDVELPND